VSEDQIITNLEKCPHYDKCNQNICPLDYEMYLKFGGESTTCRWMRERKAGHRKFRNKEGVGRVFYSSGSPTMPDELLKYVPSENVQRLNTPSKKRWNEIMKKIIEKI